VSETRPIGLRRGLAANLAVDVAMPWLTVQVLDRVWHMPTVPAFAIAALFPVAAVLCAWTLRHRVDVIAIVVLVTILGGITIALLTDDVRYVLVKAAPGFGLFGAACLVSLAAQAPLMFYVARQFNTAGDPAKVASFTARLDVPRFRNAMRFITIVWGIACLIEAAAGISAAFLLRPEMALIVEPILGLGTVALLLTWTFRFARRSADPRVVA
jgi:hypothetical protein